MTHFLLVYDLSHGRVVVLDEFPDSRRAEALEKRFALEREHAANPNLEIIVLSAVDRATLEATHARYFKNVQELAAG